MTTKNQPGLNNFLYLSIIINNTNQIPLKNSTFPTISTHSITSLKQQHRLRSLHIKENPIHKIEKLKQKNNIPLGSSCQLQDTWVHLPSSLWSGTLASLLIHTKIITTIKLIRKNKNKPKNQKPNLSHIHTTIIISKKVYFFPWPNKIEHKLEL